MDEAEADVLAYMGFQAQHRIKLHSTEPLERFNGEIKRGSEVGISKRRRRHPAYRRLLSSSTMNGLCSAPAT